MECSPKNWFYWHYYFKGLLPHIQWPSNSKWKSLILEISISCIWSTKYVWSINVSKFQLHMLYSIGNKSEERQQWHQLMKHLVAQMEPKKMPVSQGHWTTTLGKNLEFQTVIYYVQCYNATTIWNSILMESA